MSLFSPGQLFGRYRIEVALGRGGMGEVYRAFDMQLERPVAIKVLRQDKMPTEELVQRFAREARLGARLTHPNTVAVFDSGTLDGIPFIVMEYIDGRSLAVHAKDPDCSPRKKLRWLTDAARGLAAAHALGILHRDMKPENVLVSADGLAKVADFGLGKRHEMTANLRVTYRTQLGWVVGTPLYMAPEQLEGEEIDARADQFSWALTAYFVLSGAHPRYGNPILAIPLQPIHQRVFGVPEHAGVAIMKAMSLDMKDRFGAMTDLVHALAPDGDRTSSRKLAVKVAVPGPDGKVVIAPPPSARAVIHPPRKAGPASSGKRAKQKHVSSPRAAPVAYVPAPNAVRGGAHVHAEPSPTWRFLARKTPCPIAPIRTCAVGADGRTALALSERGIARFDGRWIQLEPPAWFDATRARCLCSTPDGSFVGGGDDGFLFRFDRDRAFHRWDLGKHARVSFRGVTASEHRVDLAGVLGQRGVVATLDRGGARFIDAPVALGAVVRNGSLFVCGAHGVCGYVSDDAQVHFFERMPPDLRCITSIGSELYAAGFGGWIISYALDARPEVERVETTGTISFLALEGRVPWAASDRGRFLRRENNVWKRKSPDLEISGGIVAFYMDDRRLTAIAGDGAIISATPHTPR